MTGKDFFGKLLTNREDDTPHWDRDERAISPTDRPDENGPADADDRSPPSGDAAGPPPRIRYVEEPVSELSTRTDLDEEETDPQRIETTFDPSRLRSAEPGGPGGDGLNTDPPEVKLATTREPVDPPARIEPSPAGTQTSDEPPAAHKHAEDGSSLTDPDGEPPALREPVEERPPAAPEPADEPPVAARPLAEEPDIVREPTEETAPSPEAAAGLRALRERIEEPPSVAEPTDEADVAAEHLGEPVPSELDPALAHPEPIERSPSDDLPEPPQAEPLERPVSDDHPKEDPAPPADSTVRSAPPEAAAGDGDLSGIRDRVVLRLLDKRIVTTEQVQKALNSRTKDNLKATLWRIVGQDPTVDREKVYREAALTYAFVERSVEDGEIDLEFVRQVADVFPEKKRNRLIELRIVPIGYEFEQQTQTLRVVFITHDPSLPAVRELMQDLNLERYELQYAPETHVRDLLARAFPKKNEYLERMSDDPLAYDLGSSYEGDKSELIDEEALEAEINRSSLINLFEGALVEAVHRGASDIHIYPNAQRQIEIHFRVDGRLAHWHTEDKVHPESMLAVIKDNTMNVDRFERDMAQDGFIQRKVDEALIRYRVSILPIATASNNLHAESIVIRVLDDRKVITDLSKLGLLKGALERFDMAIRQPHGMVILTGPTGSGKSTTLVAALHQVVTPEVNVLTVEDPVEYIIPGVRQIKLNHKLGLEGALRAILRHDPDVVMVGEMRDKETAELAVKLANTGHLTFSTLHTNDAPSAVSRLYKMGVEPFLIAYAINLVVAQRLLRTLCPSCKVVDNDPDPVLLKRLGFTDEHIAQHPMYRTSGDPTCKTCKGLGYKGRRAISEALYFSREIRHTIVEADMKIDEDGLRNLARSQGMLTLQDSAREVVIMGETSVEEMMRVTMTEE